VHWDLILTWQHGHISGARDCAREVLRASGQVLEQGLGLSVAGRCMLTATPTWMKMMYQELMNLVRLTPF
jgi:hypothetical protein